MSCADEETETWRDRAGAWHAVATGHVQAAWLEFLPCYASVKMVQFCRLSLLHGGKGEWCLSLHQMSWAVALWLPSSSATHSHTAWAMSCSFVSPA